MVTWASHVNQNEHNESQERRFKHCNVSAL